MRDQVRRLLPLLGEVGGPGQPGPPEGSSGQHGPAAAEGQSAEAASKSRMKTSPRICFPCRRFVRKAKQSVCALIN